MDTQTPVQQAGSKGALAPEANPMPVANVARELGHLTPLQVEILDELNRWLEGFKDTAPFPPASRGL